ncbi:MAG: hypothetical protein COZ16_04970 [Flavobacteriaceae bacterium CG_4_10_14_3_um_filter_31_253]|nr:MAG: hypothetical protein AUK46_09815 [Flavobacteriaceae bacterium CG2_30_31_66]PIV96893.1 MAG: hypothetical protein COW43_05575 [Flavobacteriaceae bacterium CG17_big_fil_post_rev_8_21_14_2_50_31_13]PIX12718.1 MAG: hypothetical protein COZ74_10135 [Flavobacteriaceae bacterium CG_4_8_14_3_um_filter_31_8]PIY15199.1 MAG: hypothetical protein COZ16_04970 [Flavobacteriaceae bacterium CG_4_10_14_3_um_filter_31_253]PIZ10634.1 MAG: hypothetical protein COY55_07765 [Flavobacteriaceae bacterium CG_4_1
MLESYKIEIASVMPPPIKLDMCDSINCPVCDVNLLEELDINLKNFVIDENTLIKCRDCDIIIKLEIKII